MGLQTSDLQTIRLKAKLHRHKLSILLTPIAAFGAIAILASASGILSPANTKLFERGQNLFHDGFFFGNLLYPPIPTLLARVAPHIIFLSLISATVFGVVFSVLFKRLTLRQMPRLTKWACLGSVFATPVFVYVGTQDFVLGLSTVFLALALATFMEFAVNGTTYSGFIAGLLIGLTFFIDIRGLVFVIALTIGAVILGQLRNRQANVPSRTLATALVIGFPAAVGILSYLYVEWLYSIKSFSFLRPETREYLGIVTSAFPQPFELMRALLLAALFAPLYIAVGYVLVKRNRLFGVGYPIPLVLVVLVPAASAALAAVTSFFMLAMVALVSLPAGLTRAEEKLVTTAACAQFVLGWVLVSAIIALMT